jgi:hypothetical protein
LRQASRSRIRQCLFLVVVSPFTTASVALPAITKVVAGPFAVWSLPPTSCDNDGRSNRVARLAAKSLHFTPPPDSSRPPRAPSSPARLKTSTRPSGAPITSRCPRRRGSLPAARRQSLATPTPCSSSCRTVLIRPMRKEWHHRCPAAPHDPDRSPSTDIEEPRP